MKKILSMRLLGVMAIAAIALSNVILAACSEEDECELYRMGTLAEGLMTRGRTESEADKVVREEKIVKSFNMSRLDLHELVSNSTSEENETDTLDSIGGSFNPEDDPFYFLHLGYDFSESSTYDLNNVDFIATVGLIVKHYQSGRVEVIIESCETDVFGCVIENVYFIRSEIFVARGYDDNSVACWGITQ